MISCLVDEKLASLTEFAPGGLSTLLALDLPCLDALRILCELDRASDHPVQLLTGRLGAQATDVSEGPADHEVRQLSSLPVGLRDPPGAVPRDNRDVVVAALLGVLQSPRRLSLLTLIELLESHGKAATMHVFWNMCEVCVDHAHLLSWVYLLRHTTPD